MLLVSKDEFFKDDNNLTINGNNISSYLEIMQNIWLPSIKIGQLLRFQTIIVKF